MPASPPYRILSFDGGVAACVYLRALREIERRKPFIKTTAAFAGTSDGAVAALYLSRWLDKLSGEEALSQAINLADSMLQALQPSLLGYLRLVSGCWAMTRGDDIRALFEQSQYFGVDTKLKDLSRDVNIVSYEVTHPARIRVLHNYGVSADGETTLVDAAFSSGSFPVILPVFKGRVDGGLMANNPASIAVAQAATPAGHWAQPLSAMRCWSLGFGGQMLGGDCVQSAWAKRTADWGYLPWFLYPTDLLLFAQALFNSSDGASSYQCRQLLGSKRFLRLDLPGNNGVITGVVPIMLRQAKLVIRRAELTVDAWVRGATNINPTFNRTLDWVEKEWLPE